MTHIFFVHSHICFAVSLAIIEYEKLNHKNIFFITDRKYTIADKKWIRFVTPPEEWLVFEKNVIKTWKNLKLFESYVKTISPCEFQFYCPHTLSPFNSFMSVHPNCRAYHLIEEGTNSYLTIAEMDEIHPSVVLGWKQRIWSAVFYRGRFHTLSFFRNDNVNSYCTDGAAFPDSQRKIVLKMDFSRFLNLTEAPSVKMILALDSAVETKYAAQDSYLAGIRCLIDHIKSTCSPNWLLGVKLHPYQYVNRIFADQVIETLKMHLGENCVVELDPNFSIEAISWSANDRLYLGISSLAIYANRNSAQCYSYAQVIAAVDKMYEKRLLQQPKIFIDSVKFI